VLHLQKSDLNPKKVQFCIALQAVRAYLMGYQTHCKMILVCINIPKLLPALLGFLLLFFQPGLSQNISGTLKDQIQSALLSGDSARCWQLFSKAKSERGNLLGQAASETEPGRTDSSTIDSEKVLEIWNLALDQLMVFQGDCPENPTESAAGMLGVCFAQFASNQAVPKEHLQLIALNLEAQQFNKKRAANPNGFTFGSFAYLKKLADEPCSTASQIDRIVSTTEKQFPEVCLKYSEGKFAESTFMVADQGSIFEKWDAPMAYHQGWAVEEMIHGFLATADSTLLKSALLGGEWCLNEKPVLNLHLVAKLVWALAALYDYTGEEKYKTQMLKLLKTNLLPSILMDSDGNGFVDGTGIQFDSLVPYAKTPGRVWDAQNASSWNTSIVGWALVNAYSALRDRGDFASAKTIYPFALAVVNNIALEIVQSGTPPIGPGFRDVAYCIFEALWKIDRAEKFDNPLWHKSAGIIWNAGSLRTGGQFTVNLGQLVRWISKTPYRARFQY